MPLGHNPQPKQAKQRQLAGIEDYQAVLAGVRKQADKLSTISAYHETVAKQVLQEITDLLHESLPWRPAAVMSTTWRENYSFPRIFKGLMYISPGLPALQGHHASGPQHLANHLHVFLQRTKDFIKRRKSLFNSIL
jgi:hypothetical protein